MLLRFLSSITPVCSLKSLDIIKTPSIKLNINLDNVVRGKFLHNSIDDGPTSTHLLSAKYSKKCEGCLVTQVMFANKIECIGGEAGLHLGQNFDRKREIVLVLGEIFIDISHNILAVANLISKIFNLRISYPRIKC